MIIQCDSCKTKYRLNEDKIAGKGARVKCRKCSDYIIVMKPEYEHLKGEFISGIQAEELKKQMEEEASEEQRDTAPAEPPAPPSEQYETEQEVAEDVSAPAAEDTGEALLSAPQAPGEDLPHGEGIPAENATEGLPSAHDTAPEEDGIDTVTEPVPGDMQREDAGQDDMDMAFEKFLGSLRDESQILPESADYTEFEGTQRKETTASDDEEEAITEGFPFGKEEEKEGVRGEDAEDPQIMTAGETLDFISKDAEVTEAKEDFDLKLQDTKIDFEDSLDFTSAISREPSQDEGEADHEYHPSVSADSLMESPAETLMQEEEKIKGDISFPEGDISDMHIDISEPISHETASPYEYVPKTYVRRGRKSKIAGFLLVLLVFLIAIAGGGAYLAFTEPGNALIIKYAPQVRALLGMKGGVSVGQFDITNLIGYYDTNQNEGKIFIIKGDVVNLSNTVNSGIVLKGQLLDERSNVLRDKTVYAGNLLGNKILKNSSKRAIEEALQNKLGKNLSNIDIQPGSSVPFMIVFFDLPEKIEAYKVESIE
ncbi:MAG: DUF3426 domain-containing protein [Deltaproteobacteria bacterium]|nr:DUF3426 domain-containing protein [Deltaproteobacteria bacterium]NIS77491.1 DUF3426 domain-containing protein [Deltaproteobacteria bacterium]